MGTEDIMGGRSNELIFLRTGQNRLSKLVKALVFVVCAVGPTAFLLPSSAQQIGLVASATPEKIFIANAGGDFGGAPFKALRGGADRAYNEFFAAMKDWGRYEIVADP